MIKDLYVAIWLAMKWKKIKPKVRKTIFNEMCRLRNGDSKTNVVCLCGSTRFTDEMLIKQWELTKAGKIVLSWCALPESYFKGSHIGDIESVKDVVDEVHKRKIDLSDEVLVINVGGYIGDSTRSEIEYANKIGVPVIYLEQALKSKGDSACSEKLQNQSENCK